MKGFVTEAVINGIRYNGHRLTGDDRAVVFFLDSVRSKAWSASTPKTLPLTWWSYRLDIPLRTLKRRLAILAEAKVIETRSTPRFNKRSGHTTTGATYALTDAFQAACEDYCRTVVRTAKGSAGVRLTDLHALLRANPGMTLQEACDHLGSVG
jgi:hypothetical protein